MEWDNYLGASLGVGDTGRVASNTAETVGIVTVITVVRFGLSGAFANTLRGEVFHAFCTQILIKVYLLGETFGYKK